MTSIYLTQANELFFLKYYHVNRIENIKLYEL